MNINYCGYVQAIADYKKEHINPLPGVTKEHTLQYSGLFINDQVYNHILMLKEELKTAGLFRFSAKRDFQKAEYEIAKYNLDMRSHVNVYPEIFASVLQDMEDCFMKDIDILKYSISQIMLDHNISGVDNRIASLSMLINIFCQSSRVLVKFYREDAYEIFGIHSDKMDYLLLPVTERYTAELAASISGKSETSDNSQRATEAFNVFVTKLIDPERFGKIAEKYNQIA
ncbi:hypothetical protein [Parabacteroides sp. AF17-28]|jgi:hypothetical protein|uniref:hypothetical protein n=1 Tax=Parabacteroides sp. AF17-28 TaxID=2292241 RepID=UPI000EFFAE1B|nr:hypothetical protein [Parabacteroides sp. AF17-28]RHR62684.1 hypothetical protein DWW90_00175 [Parabacteroides sp. AF17-28]